MNDFSEKNFILIENQVAAPENDVAALLNISIEELHALCNKIGVTNTPGGIYEKDGKYYFSSDRIIFKVRDKNGKNTADLSTAKLATAFYNAEEKLLPKDILKSKRKKDNRKTLIGIAIVICFIGIIFLVGGEKDRSENKNPPATVAEKVKSDFYTMPGLLSGKPGLGATRAEFEKVYRETGRNGKSQIRYNDDAIIVEFFGEDGEETEDKTARAFLITIQPVNATGKNISIKDLLPTDSQNVKVDTKGSDNMISIRNGNGGSAMLAKIYPKSEGKWTASINNDAKTGEFLGATIMIKYPMPESLKK